MKGIVKTLFSVAVSAAVAVSSFSSAVFVKAGEKEKLIALTFDDGPNTTVTTQILDLFEEYDAKGTFFLIGQNINSMSEKSVKRAYDMGCEIANHSKSHTYMTDKSEAEMLEEVSYVDDYVYRITGEHTKFFRAPYLNTSAQVYETIDQTFISGVMIEDVSTEPSGRAAEILRVAKDGLIILMHDSEANQPTVDALKIALPELKKQGYRFVTVSELFELQGETPLGDRSYSEVTKYPCSGYKTEKTLFTGKASDEGSWSTAGQFDKNELGKLSDYAVEVEYTGMSAPQIVIQKWGANQIWKSIMPSYSNGSRACFMSSDIENALKESGVSYSELDQFCISPYGSGTSLTSVKILVPGKSDTGESSEVKTKKGDINSDGKTDVSDLVLLSSWMFGENVNIDQESADTDGNSKIDIVDFITLKSLVLGE